MSALNFWLASTIAVLSISSGCGGAEPESDCVRYAKLERDGAKQRADDAWENAQYVISEVADDTTRRELREQSSVSRDKKYQIADDKFEKARQACDDAERKAAAQSS